MTLRREQYWIEVSFTVDAPCLLDHALHGLPVEVALQHGVPGRLHVEMGPNDGQRTRLSIRWEFEAWYPFGASDDPEVARFEETWAMECVYIPPSPGSVAEGKFLGAESAADLARDYLGRLSFAAGAPGFWHAIRSARLDLPDAQLSATVAGRTTRLRSNRISNFRLVQFEPRQNVIDAPRLARIAATPARDYLGFLLTADRRVAEGARADAVTHLYQALEVAAYECLRRHDAFPRGNWHFKVRECFGPKRRKEILFYNRDAGSFYPRLCELEGARNEWIHNGRASVREYCDKRGFCDKEKTRNLTFDDYLAFRSAVVEALEWLGEPAP